MFKLREVTYSPETPRLKQPFTVKGKIDLFNVSFLAPLWVQVGVTYPETFWEEITPIIGSPTVKEGVIATGGDFEVKFPKGFDREGEFELEVNVYAGPTYSLDSIILPPFPPAASEKFTFIVAGEEIPEEETIREFRILGYSKNGGDIVTYPGVLELDVGDRCRVHVGLGHMGDGLQGEFHAAIWQWTVWDPHDQILDAEKVFTVPASPTTWEAYEGYIDILITSGIAPGTEYGLYVKIMGITGGDVFTEYLENVITIVGVPEEELELLEVKINPSGAGYVTTSPIPESGTQHNWYFLHGTLVSVTAHPNPGYRFKSWSGEMTDTTAITAPVYPMTEKRTITAHFEEEAVAPPSADIRNLEFVATKGTYEIGDKVPYICSYEYKGRGQRGQINISLGTGVAPTFSTALNYYPIEVSFGEAMDWTHRSLSGTFQLTEDLEPGRTYNTRAKLEALEDYAQETDTDWTVLTIKVTPPPPEEYTLTTRASPLAAGWVTKNPDKTSYVYYERVELTAHEAPGYVFDHWGGDAFGTSLTSAVYMTGNKSVTAYFKAIAAPPLTYALTTAVLPSVAYGWVKKDPDKATYNYNERVEITAIIDPHVATTHVFSYWIINGIDYDVGPRVNIIMDEDHKATAVFAKRLY